MHIRTAKDIGVLMRSTRRRRNWTQTELARRAGTTQKWISAVENGRPGAPIDQVLRVLTVLGLQLTAQLPDDRPPSSNRGGDLIQRALGKGHSHGKS